MKKEKSNIYFLIFIAIMLMSFYNLYTSIINIININTELNNTIVLAEYFKGGHRRSGANNAYLLKQKEEEDRKRREAEEIARKEAEKRRREEEAKRELEQNKQYLSKGIKLINNLITSPENKVLDKNNNLIAKNIFSLADLISKFTPDDANNPDLSLFLDKINIVYPNLSNTDRTQLKNHIKLYLNNELSNSLYL